MSKTIDIQDLYPPGIVAAPASVNGLMRTLLMRAMYDQELKNGLGCRGVFTSNQGQECWTLKFAGYSGVFGLMLASVDSVANGPTAEFCLYYFPAPDDRFLDDFSLAEHLLSAAPDYLERVRHFSAHEEMHSQFQVARLLLEVVEEWQLYLCYEAQTRMQVIAADGVDVERGGEQYCLIQKDGLDRNVPSFRLMLPFFHFFNTALTRALQVGPRQVSRYLAPGMRHVYRADGAVSEMENADSRTIFLHLNYAQSPPIAVVGESMSSLAGFMCDALWWQHDTLLLRRGPHAGAVASRPKLIVVTGFLGSGKTSFLRHFIEYETERSRFVGLIQNEIGETGIDGKLLDYDYSLVEVDEGCVCCSLAGQLRLGVDRILERFRPDTILLETTGAANPFNLLSELHGLKDMVDFEAIVCVVDCQNAHRQFAEYELFKDQVCAADVLLLNKTDLVNEQTAGAVEQLLRELNRCAKIIPTIDADLHPNVLSDVAGQVATSSASVATFFQDEGNRGTHRNDGISSLKITIDEPLCRERFEKWLQSLPEIVVRVKGVVPFAGYANRSLLQFVGRDYTLTELADDRFEQSFIVCIGKDIMTDSSCFHSLQDEKMTNAKLQLCHS